MADDRPNATQNFQESPQSQPGQPPGPQQQPYYPPVAPPQRIVNCHQCHKPFSVPVNWDQFLCDNCGATTFLKPQGSASTPEEKTRYAGFGFVAAGLLAVLGSFLPWVSATGGFATFTRSGMEGGDGIFTLGGALLLLLAGLMLVVQSGSQKAWGTGGLIGSFIVGGITLLNYVDLAERVERVQREGGGLATASIGAGIWTLAFSAGLGFILSVIALQSSKS